METENQEKEPFLLVNPNKLSISDKTVLLFLSIVVVMLSLFFIYKLNEIYLHERPYSSTPLTEVFINIPKINNPVFATSQTEKDILFLLHSRLFIENEDGEYFAVLAEDIKKVEEEGDEEKNFFILSIKDKLSFHDERRMTIEDVLFTINEIQRVGEESPFYKNVKDFIIHPVNEREIKIETSRNEYEMKKLLSIPVLPSHIWKKVKEEERKYYNGAGVHIGSGPYLIKNIIYTIDGLPSKMSLVAFKDYVLGVAYIKKFDLIFIKDTKKLIEEFNEGSIDNVVSLTPVEVGKLTETNKQKKKVINTRTNKVFGIFINKSEGKLLSDEFLRSIISSKIERKEIIDKVLLGNGREVYGLYHDFDYEGSLIEVSDDYLRQILNEHGWEFKSVIGSLSKDDTPFSLKMIVPDIDELVQVAEVVARQWESISIKVNVEKFELGEFEKVFASGDYDVSLYGYEAENVKDLVSLWHSEVENSLSSRFNLDNEWLDELLEKLQKTTTGQEELMVYNEIVKEIDSDIPVIFLYSPNLIYLVPKSLKGIQDYQVLKFNKSEERFQSIHKWYLEKEKVWKIFIN